MLVSLCVFAFLACDDAALDYSGTWAGTYTEGEGPPTSSIALSAAAPNTLTITITQNGTILTGIGGLSGLYTFTDGTISGTVTAEVFTITIDFDDSGTVIINGTFSSETSASGTYNPSFGASGTFSITRQ